MDFVDLHRDFAPIGKEEEPLLLAGRDWGRRMAGWLGWPELLKRRRVVLLAEASCGKTEEFRYQQRRLAAEGKAAFFVPVEDLADHGLDASLGPTESAALAAWKSGGAEGYFFLDSVDEARLNRKSFDSALRRLARELDGHLRRAHLFISCRVSDWRGSGDRNAIIQQLPVPPPAPPPPPEPETALLAPIFDRKEERREPAETDSDLDELLVVQLLPLDDEQRRALARAAQIGDVDALLAAIHQHGLDTLAERPGDLLDLIEYWRTHRRFGSLAEMTEHAIARKLSERDKYRPDNAILTLDDARKGAERVAAALTLAKTFTVVSPAQELDPSLAAGALDADKVLPDSNESARNALLRRPCFAPSTYGRIRFHHRGTQEYLTASWFDRLLRAGCPKEEVWPLFFAERYGVDTMIPSMRAAGAWLALKHNDFLDEVIRREPLVLIQHGDPGSVPLHAKRKLLSVYAARHAAGEISDDRMDRRAIWMFAQPELADAIRAAWAANARQDFRRDLLCMIEEARIAACADLARAAFNDPQSDEYTRIAALRALAACQDTDALKATAADLLKNPEAYPPSAASAFSRTLFPVYITTRELLSIIEMSQRPPEDSLDGFPSALEHLYGACPDQAARDELLAGLSALALRPPYTQDYKRISGDYAKIAESIEPLARKALESLPPSADPTPALVRALMAVERADHHEDRDHGEPLSALVRAHPQVNRALFWADVEDVRAASRREAPISFHQVHFSGHRLWGFAGADLAWLRSDLQTREHLDDRRIALSAIVPILRDVNGLDAALPELRAAISGQPLLEEDLTNYLTPPSADPAEASFQQRAAERKAAAARQEEQDKASWRQFRDGIIADPGRLRDPSRLNQAAGISDLRNLSRWLRGDTDERDTKAAALLWRNITPAFSQDVAEAYSDGMSRLWRIVTPLRPQRHEGGPITIQWQNILAFAGIGVEAAENPDWASRLTPDEAALAAAHACQCEEGYPDWLGPLLDRHSQSVLPVIQQEIQTEWQAAADYPDELLRHFARSPEAIPEAAQQTLLDVITSSEAPSSRKAELAVDILNKIPLHETTRKRIACAATTRLDTPRSDDDRVFLDLATLFLTDAGAALARLKAWIDTAPGPDRKDRAERTLARLFGRDHFLVSGVLRSLPVPMLSDLARFTYFHVSPADDVHHEGSYTPDTRDDAESARNAILNALLDRPGEEAYLVVKGLAEAGIALIPPTRFRELAHGKAERDAEFEPWQPDQVVTMETRHIAPIRTSHDLIRVITSVLQDIQRDLAHEDASSRTLLLKADSENLVQNWLAEQLRLRSKGRYHVHREPEVAEKNEPDIVVSAVGAPLELAIEVKHGGKPWTVADLEQALSQQLATDYLRTQARRSGILVITHHGRRTWRAPEYGTRLSFGPLISRLKRLAETVTSNPTGSIKVQVVGIDAAAAAAEDQSPKK
jgi:hypothetical protein